MLPLVLSFVLRLSVSLGLVVVALQPYGKVAMRFQDFFAAPETPIFLPHIRVTLPHYRSQAQAPSKLSVKIMLAQDDRALLHDTGLNSGRRDFGTCDENYWYLSLQDYHA